MMEHITAENIERATMILYAVSHAICFIGVPSWVPKPVAGLIQKLAANYGKSANAK